MRLSPTLLRKSAGLGFADQRFIAGIERQDVGQKNGDCHGHAEHGGQGFTGAKQAGDEHDERGQAEKEQQPLHRIERKRLDVAHAQYEAEKQRLDRRHGVPGHQRRGEPEGERDGDIRQSGGYGAQAQAAVGDGAGRRFVTEQQQAQHGAAVEQAADSEHQNDGEGVEHAQHHHAAQRLRAAAKTGEQHRGPKRLFLRDLAAGLHEAQGAELHHEQRKHQADDGQRRDESGDDDIGHDHQQRRPGLQRQTAKAALHPEQALAGRDGTQLHGERR